MLGTEQIGANFLVFIYEGGDRPHHSWSVESYLLTETNLGDALEWIRDHLPPQSCWALGVVVSPVRPDTGSEVAVHWIIGADVLNTQPHDRSAEERLVAAAMLQRRDKVTFP